MNELKGLIHNELINPTDDFVRYFAKQVYPSVVTAKVLEQFSSLTKRAIQQHINDLINDRLKNALSPDEVVNTETDTNEIQTEESKVITTEDELEGFMIVKTILRQIIPVNRITYRDAQSYFAILLDDNNRKSICRLYLNGNKKFIATFDEQKKEIKNEITSLDDIFNFSDELKKTVEVYDGGKESLN
jgi:hypothetical protein